MKENIGYQTAVRLGRERLAACEPRRVAAATGVTWDGETYHIPWMGGVSRLDQGKQEEQILWLHYLASEGPKQPRGRYINYKQVPGAAIYNDNFIKRAISPMVEAFHQDLDLFSERGKRLGGVPVRLGHRAFTIQALPYIPLTYILWQGDEEVPPNGNILFDETAIEWLCAEDLVYLASLPVYMMF